MPKAKHRPKYYRWKKERNRNNYKSGKVLPKLSLSSSDANSW